MGLFSDYLEECRSKTKIGEIDPCMLMGNRWGERGHYSSYYSKLRDYSRTDATESDKQKISHDLIQKSIELERIKSGYLVAEKALFEMENHWEFQSSMIRELVTVLRNQLHDAYGEICELRHAIDKQLDYPHIPAYEAEDEMQIRKRLLYRLINSVLFYLENDTMGSTSECRRVIGDCANLIRCLEKENYGQENKEVFAYYLERSFGLSKGKYRCKNCHTLLYNDISYCLNCYERNS